MIDEADLSGHEFLAKPSDGLLCGDDSGLSLLLELSIKLLESAYDTFFSSDFEKERAFFQGIDSLRIGVSVS